MITFRMPSGITYRWNGSRTVNVYLAGREVDVWSMYPCDGSVPTQLQILGSILERDDMSTDYPLVRCVVCGTACPASTEYDIATCQDCDTR